MTHGCGVAENLPRRRHMALAVACFALAAAACGGASPGSGPIAPSASVGRTCPGGIIGDAAARPAIRLVGPQPNAAEVSGTASNIDARVARVVVWAFTDRWYVQPFVDTPFTPVCADGTWSTTTHPWTRLAALLVSPDYRPESTREVHPANDVGVLGWDEFPEPHSDRVIEFSGHTWFVKRAEQAGPGPNAFSDSLSTVFVGGDGLHLRIEQRDGRWYSSEVFAQRSLGFGTYSFQIASRLDILDPQVVFSGFLFESLSREIDIEFSRALASPHNAQYVVQPFGRAANVDLFDVGPEPVFVTNTMQNPSPVSIFLDDIS